LVDDRTSPVFAPSNLMNGDQGVKSRFESDGKRLPSFAIVQIPNIAKVAKVERDIGSVLCDQDDFSAQRVGNTDFVKHVGISARAIANYYARSVDQRDNILNDCGIFPDIISPAAAEANSRDHRPEAVSDQRKCRIERHHKRDKHRLYIFVLRDRENAWPLAARLEIAKQHAVEIDVLHSPMGAPKFEIERHVEFKFLVN
jgi:hypothetical protein